MSDIGKSLHISYSELACKDGPDHTPGTPYPAEFIADGRVIELVVMFERIRRVWDKAIVINSAYRTEAYNASVGGSPHSQHLLGKALDLHPPEGVDIKRFHDMLKSNHKFFGIRGLGLYKTFCHCDIRDSETLVEWEGKS